MSLQAKCSEDPQSPGYYVIAGADPQSPDHYVIAGADPQSPDHYVIAGTDPQSPGYQYSVLRGWRVKPAIRI